MRFACSLQLLDWQYPDPRVRAYAVQRLQHALDDEGLRRYVLQLAQCLKWEPFHDSALARLLLRRALLAPAHLGHLLFWHLRSNGQGTVQLDGRRQNHAAASAASRRWNRI